MDKDTVEFILKTFEDYKSSFIESINSGEFVGLVTFFFNRCLNEMKIEDKSKFVDNFCHVLISTFVLSIFPITENKDVEANMTIMRQRVYTAIMFAINQTSA